MNELETIIHEVHNYIINNIDLSPDISCVVKPNNKIVIVYGNIRVLLKRDCFVIEYTEYKHRYEHYVIDKDLHFEQSLMNEVLCSCGTIRKMIQIRSWYGLDTRTSTEFLTEFNETE